MSTSWRIPLSLVIAACLNISCSKWLNEDKPKNQTELSSRCLKNWSRTIDRYFEGTAVAQEVDEFWDCLDKTIWTFQNYSKGSKPGVYSITELRNFFSRHFYEKTLSDALVTQFEELKFAIFGGDRASIDTEDLSRLHLMIAEFKYGTKLLLPSINVFKLKDTNRANVYRAVQDLKSLGKRWKVSLAVLHQDYNLDHLMIFWTELSKLFDIEILKNQKIWEGRHKLIKATKSLLIGYPGDQIFAGDWPFIYERIADLASVYILFEQVISTTGFMSHESLQAAEFLGEAFFKALKDSIKRHPHEKIKLQEIKNIIAILKEYDWVIPGNIRETSIFTIIDNLGTKILKADNDGLGIDAINYLEAEVARWHAMQKFIGETFASKDNLLLGDVINKLEKSARERPSTTWLALTTEGDSALQDSKLLLENIRTSEVTDTEKHWIFKRPTNGYRIHKEALININWMHSVLRLIYRGYGSGETLRELKLPLSGFDQFYRDVRDLGVDLGMLDPKSFDSGKRTFQEADNFTLVSDGDGNLSMPEAIEELMLMSSAGYSAKKMLVAAITECFSNCLSSEKDTFGFSLVEKEKFKEFLVKTYPQYLAHLPRSVEIYQKMPDTVKAAYIDYLVESGLGPQERGVGLGQTRFIVGVLQFVEVIMVRFDLNNDETIDTNEFLRAFPVFRNLIAQVWRAQTGREGSEEDLQAALGYFLLHGKSLKDNGFFLTSLIRAISNRSGIISDIHDKKLNLSRQNIIQAFGSYRELLP